MSQPRTRTWIWASIVLQFLGYVFDAVWHGLLSPGVEPTTVPEMVRHLGTVHLPLYVGAVGVLVSTSIALAVEARRRSRADFALVLAAAGAVLSAAAEAWHASSHLRLDTHSAPVTGVLSVIGFLVTVVAMAWYGRHGGRRITKAGLPPAV